MEVEKSRPMPTSIAGQNKVKSHSQHVFEKVSWASQHRKCTICWRVREDFMENVVYYGFHEEWMGFQPMEGVLQVQRSRGVKAGKFKL